MINSITMTNFGPIKALTWENIGRINLLIGANATGKTFLFKALYTLIRASEEFGRGDAPRTFPEILADKLYWTFQVHKFSDLITKPATGRLSMRMCADHGCGEYSFGKKTINTLTEYKNDFAQRVGNSIFIPAKEVLSLLKIISHSRGQMRSFGFDDTYYDLAQALNTPTQKGRNFKSFSDARADLEGIVQGRLDFDPHTDRWFLRQGRYKYPLHLVAEGIKKISIFDRLLGNRYLTPGSILFIDEPESALHPEALSQFLSIIASLAYDSGIQVFLASHSYFTVKNLFLIAQRTQTHLPVLSFTDTGVDILDMLDGLPDNAIIRESVRLYREEVELSFQ